MKAQLWIKLTFPGVGQAGPGKVALLRKIEEHRSISAAARAMGMSYRRAWLLVEELNGIFERPVVEKWHGGRSKGGARLTEFGAQFLARYDELVARSNDANRTLLKALGRSVRRR